jgi:hypothetical protein
MKCALCDGADPADLTTVHGVVLCQSCVRLNSEVARQLWLNPLFGFDQPAYRDHKPRRKSPASIPPAS